MIPHRAVPRKMARLNLRRGVRSRGLCAHGTLAVVLALEQVKVREIREPIMARNDVHKSCLSERVREVLLVIEPLVEIFAALVTAQPLQKKGLLAFGKHQQRFRKMIRGGLTKGFRSEPGKIIFGHHPDVGSDEPNPAARSQDAMALTEKAAEHGFRQVLDHVRTVDVARAAVLERQPMLSIPSPDVGWESRLVPEETKAGDFIEPNPETGIEVDPAFRRRRPATEMNFDLASHEISGITPGVPCPRVFGKFPTLMRRR